MCSLFARAMPAPLSTAIVLAQVGTPAAPADRPPGVIRDPEIAKAVDAVAAVLAVADVVVRQHSAVRAALAARDLDQARVDFVLGDAPDHGAERPRSSAGTNPGKVSAETRIGPALCRSKFSPPPDRQTTPMAAPSSARIGDPDIPQECDRLRERPREWQLLLRDRAKLDVNGEIPLYDASKGGSLTRW